MLFLVIPYKNYRYRSRWNRWNDNERINEEQMPYYRWRGVELTGNIKKGILFARSTEHLDELLIKREIAILSAKPVRQWFKKPIRIADQLQFFSQLATLINAGVLIPDALDIVANQIRNVNLQNAMHQVGVLVSHGIALSEALALYPQVANPIMIQLIQAGEQSGELAQTLNALCKHLAETQDFYRRLRSALLLPAITLLFFCTILVIIFVVIMPRFIDVFTTMGKDIPPLTKSLLKVSDAMRSPFVGLICAISAFMIIMLWRLTRHGYGRLMRDTLLVKLPLIGTILKAQFLAYAMHVLSVLLKGGMPLREALNIVHWATQNRIFKRYIQRLQNDVESGNSLSEAMARHNDAIFGQDMVAMIEVAEASGRLSLLLDRVSQTYYNRVMQRLSWLTLFLQPAVMILLGLCVAFLIFAVYGPIFTMSDLF